MKNLQVSLKNTEFFQLIEVVMPLHKHEVLSCFFCGISKFGCILTYAYFCPIFDTFKEVPCELYIATTSSANFFSAIRDFMFSSEIYGRLDALVSLHTYGQLFIFPYNHQRRNYPKDIHDLVSTHCSYYICAHQIRYDCAFE